MKVFTSITALAAMTDVSAMMFRTRIMLSTMYPGPARERLRRGIMLVRLLLLVLVRVSGVRESFVKARGFGSQGRRDAAQQAITRMGNEV